MHIIPIVVIGGICTVGLVYDLYYPLTRARYCWLTEFIQDDTHEIEDHDGANFGYTLQLIVTMLFFICFIVIVATTR